jgi:hypothetical protein
MKKIKYFLAIMVCSIGLFAATMTTTAPTVTAAEPPTDTYYISCYYISCWDYIICFDKEGPTSLQDYNNEEALLEDMICS